MRYRLIVSVLADTGSRLSELAGTQRAGLDALKQTITVWGKGAQQRVVRYGPTTGQFLVDYLSQSSAGESLLGLKPRGVSTMPRQLEHRTGGDMSTPLILISFWPAKAC